MCLYPRGMEPCRCQHNNLIWFCTFKDRQTHNRIVVSFQISFPFHFSACQMTSEKSDAIWWCNDWVDFLTWWLSFFFKGEGRGFSGIFQCCLVNDNSLIPWMPALIYNPHDACVYSIPCHYLKTSFIMHEGHGLVLMDPCPCVQKRMWAEIWKKKQKTKKQQGRSNTHCVVQRRGCLRF